MNEKAAKPSHFRSQFTEFEFDKWRASGWRMPSQIGDPNSESPTKLAQWRAAGGYGVAAILPMLGMMSCSDGRNNFALSVQEIARLTNTNPDTVTRAADALAPHGVAARHNRMRHGEYLSHWTVSRALCAASENREYFSFAMRLIYGGNWAMMPLVERAIYLGAATGATLVRATAPDAHWLFSDMLHPFADGPNTDIRSMFSGAAVAIPFRLAMMTLSELAKRSGVSARSLSTHLPALKPPEAWARFRVPTGDPVRLQFSPLAVYPTTTRALLFFFRDHAPHLPWDFLNDPTRDAIWQRGGRTLSDRLGVSSSGGESAA